MQATYKSISNQIIPSEIKPKLVSISWNNLQIKIEKSQKPIGKYKKVGKQTKQKLISLVEQGVSIIKASSNLRINYSTAKSILQNLKKHGPGQDYSKESTSPSCQELIHQENIVQVE